MFLRSDQITPEESVRRIKYMEIGAQRRLDDESNNGDQTPKAVSPPDERTTGHMGLSWRPKIREKELEQFIQNER